MTIDHTRIGIRARRAATANLMACSANLLGFAIVAMICGCSDYSVRTQILGSLDRIKSIRQLAILPFDCEDKSLGNSFSDALGLGFMSLGYEVVERARLSTIIAESDLRAANLLREDNLEKTGRLLGVDAVVFGSIQLVEAYDFATHWKVIMTVTSRLVDVETGKNLMIVTYSRNSDLSSENVIDIADRMCSDVRRRLGK